jgi:UDP-N-acetylglucosamine 2-epimerase
LDALARLNPDIVVLLGDRFEILVAAQAAMVARIPIAHLHGGETTEGVIDEDILNMYKNCPSMVKIIAKEIESMAHCLPSSVALGKIAVQT